MNSRRSPFSARWWDRRRSRSVGRRRRTRRARRCGRELLDAFHAIAGSVDDRAVVITGAGGNFCSGADLWAGGDGPPQHQLAAMRHVGDVVWRSIGSHPTIAKVRGVAVGPGMNLARRATWSWPAPDTRFSEIFAKARSDHRLRRVMATPSLVDMVAPRSWRCSPTSSMRPRPSIGLVNRVVPEGEVEQLVADAPGVSPAIRRSPWR